MARLGGDPRRRRVRDREDRRNRRQAGGGIFATALDRLGRGRALVVGDRLDADLAGARAAGLDGAIVLSGVTTRDEAEAAHDPRPVAIADTLADLVLA